jgi:predicted MFS family arabinose efflux permease
MGFLVARGRKRACITYCITYILSCFTKHSPQYKILMIGRVLGGIATSLLFSAFESWLVAEHNKVSLQIPLSTVALTHWRWPGIYQYQS